MRVRSLAGRAPVKLHLCFPESVAVGPVGLVRVVSGFAKTGSCNHTATSAELNVKAE